MADAAFDFVALNFERSVRRKLGAKAGGSFLNRLEFRPPGAPDGDAACVHGDSGPVSAVYWQTRATFTPNFPPLRKTRGKPWKSVRSRLCRGGVHHAFLVFVLFHLHCASNPKSAIKASVPYERNSRMPSEKNDQSVLTHIDQLVKEEERLYAKNSLTGDDQARLSEVKVALDQCWDLLRQRRALREFGEDPDKAKVRPAKIVENYEQ